jgi:hypothetical protein
VAKTMKLALVIERAKACVKYIKNVSWTPAPHSETEEDYDRRELMRIKRIAELNLWMKRKKGGRT